MTTRGSPEWKAAISAAKGGRQPKAPPKERHRRGNPTLTDDQRMRAALSEEHALAVAARFSITRTYVYALRRKYR